ncbi:MAG: metallophosphoesterase [Planctomycetota bacterium]|nr:MAG: metallophosphoesterase [Planctomycetota bacterium]
MSRVSRRDVLKAGAAASMSPVLVAMCGSTSLGADPYADARLVDGEPPKPEKGSFTVAVLPDTQNYSQRHPETYLAQTEWIAANKQDRNIACVLHLGDITNNNTVEEWHNAVKAMRVLDGQVPYFMVPGNHDYSAGGVCKDRTTRLNDHFSVGQFRELPTFGGTYDKEPDRLENSYHLFSAEGRDYLVLGLEFGPRADVVRWANEVAAKHKDRAAILITHAFIYSDSTRYDWEKYGTKQSWNPHNYAVAKNTGDDVSDGEELWNNLVSKHENFVLTLNGHVLHDGLGQVTTATPAGRDVHQVLVNFQMRPHGGDGWLRLLEFRPDGKTVQTYDYSPVLKQRNESPANQFAMQLAPVARA